MWSIVASSRVLFAVIGSLGLSLATMAATQAPPTAMLPKAAVRLRMQTTAKVVPVGVEVSLNALPVTVQGKYVGGNIGLTVWSRTPAHDTILAPVEAAGTEFSASRPGVYEITATLGRLQGHLAIRVVAKTKLNPSSTTTLVLQAPSAKDTQLADLVGLTPVPQGMPRDSTVLKVRVPLYPGARQQAVSIENYPAPIPGGSWYLLASPVRGYFIKASQTTVDRWYLNAFSQMGYLMNGEGGGSQNINTYNFTLDPKAPMPETIGIRTRSERGGTEVVYAGTTIVVPPRPSSSFYPASVRSLDLSYRSDSQATPVTFEVTQPEQVLGLVEDLNAMALNSGGVYMDCPVQGSVPSVGIQVASPTGRFPKAQLNDGDPCQTGTVGAVQVVSTPKFWALVQALAKKVETDR